MAGRGRAFGLRDRCFLLRAPWRDILQFVALIALIAWMLSLSTAKLGYRWQWYLVPRHLLKIEDGRIIVGRLIHGLLYTFKISGVSLVLTLAIGLATALLRISDSYVGRLFSRVYLEVVRNTPLVVQIYLTYFVLGPILGIGRFASAVLALSLFEGSYTSEIFRAGIVSIHKGQWEAAYSLGLSSFSTYRDIVLPQAVRRILPPLTSQVVSLVKDSALVSLVSLSDLSLEAQVIVADTFLTFEIWFTTAIIYLCVTIALSTLSSFLEKKFRILS